MPAPKPAAPMMDFTAPTVAPGITEGVPVPRE
jgi:hypothetical protein